MTPSLAEIRVGDPPELWDRLGFEVDANRVRLGDVDVVLTGADAGEGIHGWGWRGEAPAAGDIEAWTVDDTRAARREPHPNSALRVFYVVLFGPSWADAADSLTSCGLDVGEAREMGAPERPLLRSIAEAGEPAIEVIGPPERDSARPFDLWGTIIEVADIDATAAHLGDRLRPVKRAMQRGRRIATLDRTAGSSVPIAFISDRDDG